MKTIAPTFITLGFVAITGLLVACGTKPANTNIIEKISFDEAVNCNMPLGTRALPAFFSFKSEGFDDENYKGIKIAGKPVGGKSLMFYVFIGNNERNIISTSYVVRDGILKDSGVVNNYRTKTAYSYDFVIRCK